MTIVIPRVCESCGKEFVRRGRAKRCEKCAPPKSGNGGKARTPKGRSEFDQLAYARDFVGGVLLSGGVALMGVSEHDAAVVLRASRTIPPLIMQAGEQNESIGNALVKLSQKGAIFYLGVSVLATVVVPIMANHKMLVPEKLKMSEDMVSTVISQAMSIQEQHATGNTETPDIDLSFLDGTEVSDNAA